MLKATSHRDYNLSKEQADRLWALFQDKVPGFVDFQEPGEKFTQYELTYKRELLAVFPERLGRAGIQKLLDDGKPQEAVKRLNSVMAKTGMIAFQSWRATCGTSATQNNAVLRAFLDVAEDSYTGPHTVKPLFDAIAKNKLKPNWDVISMVLWALRPSDVYFPIKISYYRQLAKELNWDIERGSATPDKLDRVIAFGKVFWDALQPLKPADWVDVQSFMWVCSGGWDEDRSYWVFQANPKLYDIVGSLNDGKLTDWTVKTHIADIAKGDRAIIWVTGAAAGCYALCEITSDVQEGQDHINDGYYANDPPPGAYNYVECRVLHNLSNAPITKNESKENAALKKLNVGHQGTVFTATKEQYEAMKLMARSRNTPPAIHSSPLSVELPSKNVILYGPPGTGKTFALRTKYMEYFTDYESARSRDQFCDDLVSSMSWWEVIAMVMLDLRSAKVADILDHQLMRARVARSESRNPRSAIWAHLQMHTKRDCDNVAYSKRYEPLMFTKSEKSVWSIDTEIANTEAPELAEKLKAFKDYSPSDATVTRRYAFTTFHQSFSYEDFVEGIKPVMGEDMAGELAYEIQPGVFRQIAQRAKNDPNHDYALFIDEINRGNVASIFGELITLLEDDKRTGEAHQLTAVLPYSRHEFGVPSNLFVIGTMNTADRSVEALDTALRRRFTFVGCHPQPALLRNEQPGDFDVDLEKLLTTINARIERLLDSDHCIGHSYLMGMKAAPDPLVALRQVFANKVLPLLQEYFYGDPGRIGMILGEAFLHRRDGAAELAPGDWGIDSVDERDVYQFADPTKLPVEAFVSIYA